MYREQTIKGDVMRARIAFGVLCLGLMSGCYKTIIPHTDIAGHAYCPYRITFTSPGASMQVGQVICVYCKQIKFGGGECDTTNKFKTEDGKQYDVAAVGDISGCQSCPGEAMDAHRVFEEK